MEFQLCFLGSGVTVNVLARNKFLTKNTPELSGGLKGPSRGWMMAVPEEGLRPWRYKDVYTEKWIILKRGWSSEIA